MITSFTYLYRYARWDGTQRKKRLNADDIIAAMSDDMLEYGDMQYALQSLMHRGLPFGGNRLSGIQELIQRLKEQRQKQLERFNLDSVLDDIREKLDEVLDLEQETIEEWMTSSTEAKSNYSPAISKEIAKQHQKLLEQLPDDVAGQVKTLQGYDFLNPEAKEKFDEIVKQLRDAVTQTFFKDIENMVQSLSEGDLEKMKEMLKAMNDMLNKHADGDDPHFDDFMQQYGDMFGSDQPNSVEELLNMMQSQMAATQSLMSSLSSEQRQQLESLFSHQFDDLELQEELFKLSDQMANLNPGGQQYSFMGNEDIDLQSAMNLMKSMQSMDELEQQLDEISKFSDLDQIDSEQLRQLLGDEAADGFDELKDILDTLEKAGYIKKDNKRWKMTTRGSKRIGQSALMEIYQQLKHQGLGKHRSPKEGRFGDRLEETKAYEFGESFHLHVPRTLRNALQRNGKQLPIKLQTDDFEVYRSELNTKTATVLLLDVSWSMAMRGAFLSAKKVALALQQLISTNYSRDSLNIIGFSAYAKEIKARDLPFVEVDEFTLGTNMQHALLMAERILSKQHGGSKQIIMISDGEPTSHMENGHPFFEYPPNPITIHETLKAVRLCTKKNIAINTFMLEQNSFLKMFMNQVAKINGGRVFYTDPQHLGEYILHDYVENKRKKVGGRR